MSTDRATIHVAPGVEVTVVPRQTWVGRSRTSQREMERYTRIFVWVQNESIGENLVNRQFRPYQEWRRLLVEHVVTPIGMAGVKLRWDRHCGCSCPCSPGFVTDRHMGVDGPVSKHSWQTVYFHVSLDCELLGTPVAFAAPEEISARVESINKALALS